MSGFMKLHCWHESKAWECSFEGGFTELLEPGWFAWYTAPGYMDRTDPVGPYKGPIPALRAAFDSYGDPESPDDRRELAGLLWEARRRYPFAPRKEES